MNLKPIEKTGKTTQVVPWDNSIIFLLATLWNRYIPYGKGAIPRFLGRYFFRRKYLSIKTIRQATLLVTGDSLDMGAHVYKTGGRWNESVIKACIASLKEGDLFYDIGANLGVVSIDVCRHFRGRVKVFSFEPQRHLSDALAASAIVNSFFDLKVFDVAVGDATKVIKLYFASHSIHVSAVSRNADAKSFSVNCYSLDDLIYLENLQPPNVIKIDTEGGELNVFIGGARALKEYSPTIIFESDNNMDRWGYSREDVLNFLSSCAPYHFYIIKPDESIDIYSQAVFSKQLSVDIVATTNPEFLERYRNSCIT